MPWLLVVVIAVALYAIWHAFKPRGLSDPVGNLSGPGSYSVDVVGESHYQDALARICGGRSEHGTDKHMIATLVLEDDNRHDSHAVRVDIEGQTVGYLPRETAKQYRQRLKEAGHPRLIGRCDATIVGGWDRGQADRGSFGVKLDLPTDDDS